MRKRTIALCVLFLACIWWVACQWPIILTASVAAKIYGLLLPIPFAELN